VRKLLLLLLIAVVGAGIAFGANAIFFSTASSDRPDAEPRGLIDEIAADEQDAPTPEPKPSPSPTARPSTEVTEVHTGGDTSAPAPGSDDDGPRTPRSASRVGDPQPTSFVVQGVVDEQDPPEDPCDLEESEAEQRQCENERDRESDEQDDEDDDSDSRDDDDD
jgi:hypothetical protein